MAQTIVDGLSWPLASARPAVRGLRASMRASIKRLAAIAAVRAPSTASVISARVRSGGTPPCASSAPA